MGDRDLVAVGGQTTGHRETDAAAASGARSGSVGAVEEALLQTVSGLGRLLNYTLCELTKS